MTTTKGNVVKKKGRLPKTVEENALVSVSSLHEEPGIGPVPWFPIIGIGASAGGLAAFEAFFSGMPAVDASGMAFVLIQHLAPDHKSILSDLIRRYTRMEVFDVEEGMIVRPNCTYIIPPNRDMAFWDGALHLLDPSAPHGQRLPIDFFFRSLAQDQRQRSFCIVLSGTGHDGSQGVRAVKEERGTVMVQRPDTAEYDGMPRSALATGLADYVLPPCEMPAQLIAYVSHNFDKSRALDTSMLHIGEDALKRIFTLLRAQTGHDFSQYKLTTIKRRVERQMSILHITLLDSYVLYLQQNPAEVDALFSDLLIGVTSFFRDTEAFNVLEEKVFSNIFAGKPPGSIIRAWCIGCSTGEEAYSLAILLQEAADRLQQNHKIQLFATDIDRKAITKARIGVYPFSITDVITPTRMARFFTIEPDGSSFRINKKLRDLLIFSEHNVITAPPFSKLDLISCRNLLIYMEATLQKKLLNLFHYALKPGGLLFLGSSESVGNYVDLFVRMDRSTKLYQRNNDERSVMHPALTLEDNAPLPSVKANYSGSDPLHELIVMTLLQRYASVGVLVTDRGEILYFLGRTGRYLEPASGKAGMNILKMAREGLRQQLTTTLHKAVLSRDTIIKKGLQVKTNGDYSFVNLTIQPVAITTPAGAPTLYLVILEEAFEPADTPAVATDCADSDGILLDAGLTTIAALRQELLAEEECLQTTIQEMQSVNEELQSTNEELETSREEMQSINEELSTINTELQTKVTDLSRANNDMNNLLAGTGIGTVFVDLHLCIQRFTPAATQVINLIKSDIGRPVGHIVTNLKNYGQLVSDVRDVLDTLIPRETEVQTLSGAWYLIRIHPYRTQDNVIEGAVLTFTDISDTRQAREVLRESQTLRRLAVVVHDASDAITVQDLEGCILAWNPAATRLLGWSEEEALAMNIRDMIPHDERDEALTLVKRLSRAEVLEPFTLRRLARNGSIVDVSLTATALVNEVGDVYAVSTTERIAQQHAVV